MDFIGNSDLQLKEMLHCMGLDDPLALFSAIPENLLCPEILEDDGLSEFDGKKQLMQLAQQNTFPHFDSYLGAGAYEHHIPQIVPFITSKSGFLTAYTPYQAEASQGSLQTIYEFQTAICRLTGLEVANASVYDSASATAEAVLMAKRVHKNRSKILVAGNIHPHYRSVLEQNLHALDVDLVTLTLDNGGRIDSKIFDNHIDDTVICSVMQYPDFFGQLQDLKSFSDKVHAVQGISIIIANPLVYGLFHSAKELGADIAVGDCQPFGIPLQFGGPYVGYLAARRELMRQMPGRIVGKTEDRHGKMGFALTLQAREQHIRREKATSNICSNQALCALASLVAILWYGKKGIKELALANYQRANYLKQELEALPKVFSFSSQPIFNEFTVHIDYPMQNLQQHFRRHGIEPGLDLGRYYPHLKNHLLVAVTETKSIDQLNRYIAVAKEILS